MFVSEKHKFVFVHVPKTAGSSIAFVLKEQCSDLNRHDDPTVEIEDFFHPLGRVIRDDIGIDIWNNYFKFGFVRNPWERLVSWYKMAYKQRHIQSLLLDNIRKLSFEEFIINDPPDSHTRRNQLDYFTDNNGNIIIDFIGRFETVNSDFQIVLNKLKLIPRNLPRINYTEHGPYQEYYTEHTRKLVAERFAKDIEYFGYKFE